MSEPVQNCSAYRSVGDSYWGIYRRCFGGARQSPAQKPWSGVVRAVAVYRGVSKHKDRQHDGRLLCQKRSGVKRARKRSEEHTSELQSLTNIVCRLLLENKK